MNKKMLSNVLVPKVSWLILLMSFSLLFSGLGMAAESEVGKIDKVLGTVYLQHSWETEPSPAKINDNIFPKDRIKTNAQSKASLNFINGAVLDIGENTDLEIKELYYQPSDGLSQSTFKMKLGRIRAFVSKFINPESRFEIQTTTAVTGVVGTEQLVINEKTEKEGKAKETTRTVCTVGRVKVGSIDPKITGTVTLDAFQQVWVYEGEPPEEVMDVTMEELEQLLQDVMISFEEEKKGEAMPLVKEKRAKEEKAKEEVTKPEEKPLEKIEEGKKEILEKGEAKPEPESKEEFLEKIEEGKKEILEKGEAKPEPEGMDLMKVEVPEGPEVMETPVVPEPPEFMPTIAPEPELEAFPDMDLDLFEGPDDPFELDEGSIIIDIPDPADEGPLEDLLPEPPGPPLN